MGPNQKQNLQSKASYKKENRELQKKIKGKLRTEKNKNQCTFVGYSTKIRMDGEEMKWKSHFYHTIFKMLDDVCNLKHNDKYIA